MVRLIKIYSQRNQFRHNKLILLLIYVISSQLFHDCKKEESILPEPEVILQLPNSLTSFNYNDTVFVKARVSHNIDISTVTISITDKELKRLVGGPVLNPMKSQFNIDSYIVINNRYIEEFENYLLIEIQDKNTIYNFWYNIRINPLERELQSLLVVTSSSTPFAIDADSYRKLIRVEADGSQKIINEWNTEYLGGFADSRFGLFYSSGTIKSGVTGFNILDEELSWAIPTQSGGTLPHFTAFSASEGRVVVGVYDGSLECYDQSGLILMKTGKLSGGRFSVVLNFDTWVAGVFVPFDGRSQKLYLYNNPAGNQYGMVELPGQIIALIPYDQKTILILVDESGINKAYTYSVADKAFNFLHQITGERIHSPAGERGNIFFISDETIKWYRPGIGSIVDYLDVTDANALAFNALDNTLIVGTGNRITFYQLPNTYPYSTIELSEEIEDIDLLYNK
jgi:hypothetical protein